MNRIMQICAAALLSVTLLAPPVMAGEKILKMSTTSSTESSGLLDVLLPELEKDTGIKVKVVAKGTGAAILDGMDGNVDVIFVHAKELEDKFIADGFGTKRYVVMHNDFIIVGPAADPAGIKGMNNAVEALQKIAASGSAFISRGDVSGTHNKEQYLWRRSGLTLQQKTEDIEKRGKKKSFTFDHPEGLGKWYLSIGQGMGKTLTFADEKRAYTLTDRGTYIKYRFGGGRPVDLDILVEGGEELANPYGVIPVNPEKHPHVKYELAKTFAEWLVGERGQALIGNYKVLGKQLFYPDAVPMK